MLAVIVAFGEVDVVREAPAAGQRRVPEDRVPDEAVRALGGEERFELAARPRRSEWCHEMAVNTSPSTTATGSGRDSDTCMQTPPDRCRGRPGASFGAAPPRTSHGCAPCRRRAACTRDRRSSTPGGPCAGWRSNRPLSASCRSISVQRYNARSPERRSASSECDPLDLGRRSIVDPPSSWRSAPHRSHNSTRRSSPASRRYREAPLCVPE